MARQLNVIGANQEDKVDIGIMQSRWPCEKVPTGSE